MRFRMFAGAVVAAVLAIAVAGACGGDEEAPADAASAAATGTARPATATASATAAAPTPGGPAAPPAGTSTWRATYGPSPEPCRLAGPPTQTFTITPNADGSLRFTPPQGALQVPPITLRGAGSGPFRYEGGGLTLTLTFASSVLAEGELTTTIERETDTCTSHHAAKLERTSR